MKKIFYIIAAVATATCITSCSDNDDPKNEDIQETVPVSEAAYVLTQGNFYSGVEGGLTVIDYANGNVDQNVFKNTNGRSLGDTPQCGVAYGSKIYIGTSVSCTIEIIDRETYASQKQIKLTEDPSNGTMPYSMVAYDGYVYMSMYDGYVARLDTTTLAIDKSVAVGANPDQIALYNGKIYVPVSEGMNYPNYGTTACVVDPSSMTVEKTFTVGLNPRQFVVANDQLFLLCSGNYSDVDSKLYKVGTDYSVTEICDATLIGSYGKYVAIVNAPYYSSTGPVYNLYNTESGALETWSIEEPDYANQIFYDSTADRLMIASYVMNGSYPSYVLPGYVNVYKGSTGEKLYKCDLGAAGPACIFTHQN